MKATCVSCSTRSLTQHRSRRVKQQITNINQLKAEGNLTLKRSIALALVSVALVMMTGPASASDLTLHLIGSSAFQSNVVQLRCDAKGVALGLPSGSFSVAYVNGGGNSLVVVPVNGSSLIFASVSSGSGVRYAAGRLIWWDAAGSVTVSTDSTSGKVQSVCKSIR